MAKNKLTDLNDHLFAQLERLSEEGLSEEQLRIEVNRAKAINGIASQVISNANVQLEAIKLLNTGDGVIKDLPQTFGLIKS